MKLATLVLIRTNNAVLLGRKKTGEVGRGLLNAPGGKQEPGETLRACAAREVKEETGLTISSALLNEAAILTCYTKDIPDFRVYVYMTFAYRGEPIETSSMEPAWYSTLALPVDEMHEADRHWFVRALSGKRFNAHIMYNERGSGFRKIKFAAFTPFPQ
ncbi:MAG: NUDIX domain-containing protein [Patescibacteria group bacterium]